MVERALQIAEACAEDMLEYSSLLHKDSQACQVNKQPTDFLDNIFYFRICTYTEQIAVVNYMDKFISEHRDVSKANYVVAQPVLFCNLFRGYMMYILLI